MKKLLKLCSIITIATAPTLTIVACNNNENNSQQDDYAILTAINKATYTLAVDLNSPIQAIKNQLTPQLIKAQLSKELQTKFNDQLLAIKDITINNNPLQSKDMNKLGDLSTILNFQYASFSAQTRLTLQVQDFHIEQVVTTIKNSHYQYSNDTNSSLQDLQTAVTSEFISKSLEPKIKSYFHQDQLLITSFMKNGQTIKDTDFKVAGSFFITVNFKYYETENSFILNLLLNPTQNNEITNAIANSYYEKTVEQNILAVDLQNEITPDFIQDKLINPVKSRFKTNKFTIQNLTNKATNQLVTDKELTITSTLDININFNYDGITSKSSLRLNIIDNQDTNIAHAITNTIYSQTLEESTTIDKLTATINGTFIQDKLLNPTKDQFETSKWKLVNLLNTNTRTQLTNNDLVTAGNLDVTIQFTYNKIASETSLQLNITSLDNDMVSNISNLFIKMFALTFDPPHADQYFTAKFIKSQLNIALQSQFQENEYQFMKMDIKGFNDEAYLIWTLHFSYQGKEGTVPVCLVSEMFNRFLTDPSLKMEVKTNTTYEQLTEQFWVQLKATVIGKTPTPKQKQDYQFILDTFNIVLLGIAKDSNGTPVTDNDLATPGTFTIFIGVTINAIMSLTSKTLVIT